MSNLAEALQDLKNAALSGAALDFDGVAADYEINPALLRRKFAESYPNGVVALPTAAEVFGAKHRAKLEQLCKDYGLDPNAPFREVMIHGHKVTVLGRLRGRVFLGVSHHDGRGKEIWHPDLY